MVFEQELHLPCGLMFGAPSDKEQSTTDYAADIVKWLHDIHQIALQHLNVGRGRMKARYKQLVNSAGFQEGNRVWLYSPAQKTGKSPKLQKFWECPYITINRINIIIYRIKQHSRAKMIVIHLDRLAPYMEATQD